MLKQHVVAHRRSNPRIIPPHLAEALLAALLAGSLRCTVAEAAEATASSVSYIQVAHDQPPCLDLKHEMIPLVLLSIFGTLLGVSLPVMVDDGCW